MSRDSACVTATMDDLRLGDDITRGDLVILEAQVNEGAQDEARARAGATHATTLTLTCHIAPRVRSA